MRLIYTLLQIIAFVLLTSASQAQICEGETIHSQESLEEFGAMNCQHISGGLYIGGTVRDLTPLSNLRSMNGDLWVAASSLKNFQGLNNLDSIGGFLRIYYNDSLE